MKHNQFRWKSSNEVVIIREVVRCRIHCYLELMSCEEKVGVLQQKQSSGIYRSVQLHALYGLLMWLGTVDLGVTVILQLLQILQILRVRLMQHSWRCSELYSNPKIYQIVLKTSSRTLLHWRTSHHHVPRSLASPHDSWYRLSIHIVHSSFILYRALFLLSKREMLLFFCDWFEDWSTSY